jgi:hypothetical protein
MRPILLAVLFIGSIALVPATAVAQQKKGGTCPKDATLASRFIWPAGAISPGKLVTGRHSCGRSMQCTGGVSARRGGGRECRWL